MNSDNFILGVNYWPARKFVRMWSQFDPREIAQDFARIESLGLRLVRIFVFWPDFQPSPDRVDESQLENLRAVFELAWEHHLLLMPALLVGHMSGPNWMPRWAMSHEANNRPRVYVVDGIESAHKPRDVFGGDTQIFEAERLLIRTIVARFKTQPALWGWDICNEFDLVQLPETEAGERWLKALVADIHAIDRDHPVTAGILPWPDESPRGFHRASHHFVGVASVHAYPLYDAAAAGPGDTAYVGRMIEDTRRHAGVPVMLTEFGMPTNPDPGTRAVTMTWGGREQTVSLVDELEAARYVREVLPVTRNAGAIGALIWCYSDYDASMYSDLPFDTLVHERYFGIFDASGRLKATGEALRDFAAAIR